VPNSRSKQTSAGRRPAPSTIHYQDGDEERVLAADEVADAAEEDRAERPYREADAEQAEAGEEPERFVARREEQLAEAAARVP